MNENATPKRRRRPLPMDPAKIARRRIELGLTVTKAAAEAGIHKSYLSQIENGHRGGSPAVVLRIASALRCEPTDLMPRQRKAAA
jgi:transcriptional regulator with XRE-family HTH domain